jgi:hypothetical protein
VSRSAAFLAALLVGAVLLCAPAAAQASFGFLPGAEGFSVTATNQNETPTTQAGAHPHAFAATIGLNSAGGKSDGDLRDLRLSLPPGFLINPTVVAECSALAFRTPRVSAYEASASGESCPNSSQVGVIAIHLGDGTSRHFGLFNLAPPFGAPAQIGASPFGMALVFTARLRDADAGFDLSLEGLSESLDLQGAELIVWGTPWNGPDALRGNCLNEQTGGSYGNCLVFDTAPAPSELIKSYLTMPTTPCGSPLSFSASAASWQGGAAQAGATTPALVKCNKSLSTAKVQLMTDAAAARTGLAFNLAVNDGGGILNPGGIARPAIKTAILSLPGGLTINPSLGAGLGSCSEADFARESATSEPGAGCSNDSKIGDVTVEGAVGLAEPLKGSLYVATPQQNPFHTLLALYLVARSARRGLIVKSLGKLEPDQRTGRLLATFDDLPRLLYTHFAVTLREGQRSTLLSPPLCGTYPSDLALSSWAEPTVFRHESSAFQILRGEAGGACPPGDVPPFHPGLLAGSINPTPATYTPFHLRMTRTDSEQEITAYSASFPTGLLAKIAGVPDCPEAAIEAAKAKTGAQELEQPSCPAASRIGRTLAGYGVGETLAWAPGALYLAGPWHGSSLSVVAIDSATIGPFDLGVVVVRTAVRIDPRSGRASIDAAGSDPIPHIIDGIPIHVRDIRVYVDRPGFTLNPTNCDPLATTSTLTGAGADFFSSADDSSAISSQRYQLLGCSALGFKPRLALALRGGTKRSRHPALRAVLTPRPGDANIGAVSVTLPPSVFLAQEHLHSICTKAQYAREACPADSVYGHARAITPLLDEPLEGPVYVRSSSNRVPDLVISLRGRGVKAEVVGRIDSSRGGLRGSFESLPDAPVTKFTLTLPGGKRGLLVNAEDLCAAPQRANARFIAQNNETEVLHPRLAVKCGKRRKRHHAPTAGSSELAQRGTLRVGFDAKIRPEVLPRHGVAPIGVSVGGTVTTTDGSEPPQLRQVQIAINRAGRLDAKGLPVCHLADIQPSTTQNALRACGPAKVGEGDFSANVVIPEQSPFPSDGKVVAFNGVQGGRPVIFAHVYGTEPIPTSFTLPLRVSHARGTFGTVLTASLPQVTSSAAFVTGISLTLRRSFRYRGAAHSYLSAGCPAPDGFPGALYQLARATFSFAEGQSLGSTVTRSCRAVG